MKKVNIETVRTAEEFIKIQSMGTYEDDYKNGEIWTWNGNTYYLSPLELDMGELQIVNDALKIERIG